MGEPSGQALLFDISTTKTASHKATKTQRKPFLLFFHRFFYLPREKSSILTAKPFEVLVF